MLPPIDICATRDPLPREAPPRFANHQTCQVRSERCGAVDVDLTQS